MKKELAAQFDIKDLGELRHFLAMKIVQCWSGVYLDETHLLEMNVKSSIPATWRLLQTLDAYFNWHQELFAWNDKSFRLFHVHFLLELSIEKSCSSVYLMQLQALLN